jgi:hypothetical protein
VTVQSGIFVNRARSRERRVFITGPMSFVATGPAGKEIAIRISIAGLGRTQLGKQPRGSVVRSTGDGVSVCVPLRNQRAVLRRVVVRVDPGLTPLVLPGWFGNHPVAKGGPALQAMRVVASCGKAEGST